MRILFDGFESHEPNRLDSTFWKTALRAFLQAGNEVYLLSRTPDRTLSEIEDGRVLIGSPIDFRNLLAEDRKLAALCSEMQIDWFLSASGTSAGANVRSAFLAREAKTPKGLRDATARAARLGALHLATTEDAAGEASRIAGLPRSQFRLLGTGGGNDLAASIMKQADVSLQPTISSVRMAEEEKIQTEWLRLRGFAVDKAEKDWARRIKRQTQLLPRVLRAVQNVRGYPGYLKRLSRPTGR